MTGTIDYLWPAIALGAMILAYLQHRTHYQHINAIQAQAEERVRACQRLIEKQANRIMAFENPAAYQAVRSMSGMPEVNEAPVPTHAPPNGHEALLKAQQQVLAQRVAELETDDSVEDLFREEL